MPEAARYGILTDGLLKRAQRVSLEIVMPPVFGKER
jgi:hypothetical protein